MAAQNNVTASQTTPLLWPHLLVWERLADPAETENAFRQQTNESVALGYRSLAGGCAPSILWLTDLALQPFQTCLLFVSFGLCLWHYVMSSALDAKLGGRICLQKQHWRRFPLPLYLLLSVFLSVKPLSLLSPLLSCPPRPTNHTHTKTPYTSRFHITHCLLFSVLPPPLVLSRRLSLLCELIPTRGLFSLPFFVLSQHD